MKTLLPILGIALTGAIAISCAQKTETVISPSDPLIAYTGRIDRSNPESYRFSYPGTSAEIIFDATSVTLDATPGAGSFMVEVDSLPARKVTIAETDSTVVIADSLAPGEHRLKIIYAQEGYEARPALRGFRLSPGGKLIRKPEPAALRMEFIGNSITCGYGIESDDPKEGFSFPTENHYYSYAARTARALGADYCTVARSGIGIYRNYGSPIEGSDMDMPDIYGRTLYYEAEPAWDFSKFTPDIVCVNLGTNDTSLDTYSTDSIYNAFSTFHSRLRSNYPKAKIVYLTGAMLGGKALEDVRTILDKMTAQKRAGADSLVYRFDMTPQDGSLGYGADYHPSRRQAEKMASELTGFIESIR